MVALLKGARRTLLSQRKPYASYLRSLSGAVALWPLWETGGTNTDDIVGNNDGTVSGATLANATTPAGTPAPYFDGVNDSVEIYSAGLNSVFNPALGTAIIWCDFDGVWGDTNFYVAFQIGTDLNNRLLLYKPNVANNLQWFKIDGGTIAISRLDTSSIPAGWFMMALTWNKADDVTRAYLNGSQVGANGTSTGTWSGALTSPWTGIGESVGASFWKGWLAYAFLANQAYTPAQIADIYNRGLRS